MPEEVLTTGESARNRGLRQRNPELEESDVTNHEESHGESTLEPRPLVTFFFYSGILYVLLGFLSLLAPNVVTFLFLIKVTPQTTAYGRFAGVYLVGIGVFYVTSARSSPRLVHVNRIITGTVFERMVFVNISCMVVYFKHNGPLVLIANVMAMDSALALTTYVLWTKEANTEILASIPWTFKKFLQTCLPQNITLTRKSSSVVKVIGFLQVLVGTFFLIRPDIVQHALRLESFDEHSKGILSFGFMCFAVIGWLHVLGGSSDASLFNVVAVVYRVLFSIPLSYYLGASHQIAPNFAMCFAYFDALAAFSVGIFLITEK